MITKEQFITHLDSLTLSEAADLVKTLEDKLGVSAQAPVAVPQPGPVNTQTETVATEFSVKLTSTGATRVAVIKTIRGILKLGLKEAKDLVEAVPVVVKDGLPKEEAEALKSAIEESGGKALLSPQ